jgi:hypothetical protein
MRKEGSRRRRSGGIFCYLLKTGAGGRKRADQEEQKERSKGVEVLSAT